MTSWSYSPYVVISFLAAVLAGGIAVFSWRRRATPGAYPLMGLMLSVGLWALLYAFELANNQLDTMIALARWEYVGITLTPVCLYFFVELYTNRREYIPWYMLTGMLIIPVITLLLVFTNDSSHLIWRDVALGEVGPLSILNVSYGYGFYLNIGYAYLLLVLSAVFMFTFLWRSRAAYRGQAAILVAGILMPWLGNLIYVLKWVSVDMTPIFFSLSGVLLAWGSLRFGLLDIVPVARRAVIDAMGDAVIVLDGQRRIVDLNPAAERLMGRYVDSALGKTLDVVLPEQQATIAKYRDALDVHDELTLTHEEVTHFFDLRIFPLYDRRQRLSGRLIVMRDITERKTLETSLVQQMERFELLLAVAHATAAHPTLDATMQNTLDIAVSLTNSALGSIFLIDNDNTVTRSILARGNAPAVVSQTLVGQVMEHGLIGWVVREREVAFVEDVHTDPRWLTLPGQPYEAGSALGLPIKHGELLLGVLILIHPEPRHYTQRDIEVMTAAVQQMGLAIRNASIYEEQRRMADQQATLFEVLRTLQRPRTLPQLAQLVVSSIARLTDWGFVGLLEPDDDGGNFMFAATAGRTQLRPHCDLPIDQGVFGEAWQSGKPVYISDARRDSELLEQLCGAYSAMILPIKNEEQVTQLLYIANEDPLAFDRDAQVLAESLVEVITLATQNARLYTALQANLQRANALYQISRSLVERHELTEMLQLAVEGTAQALQADRVALFLLDMENERALELFRAGNGKDNIIKVPFEELMAGLTGWAVRRKEPVLSSKREPDPRESPEVKARRQETQVGSIAVVPLVFADTVYGTITALNRPEQPDFTADDLQLLSSIAVQVAVTVRNLRLFDHVTEEQQRLRALVQSARDGVILIGMSLQVLVVNEAALHYLGLDGHPDEWVNRTLWEALSALRDQAPYAARDLLHEMRRIERGDEPAGSGEYQIGSHSLEWYNLPVASSDKPLGRLIILRDVTEARSVEKMREDLTHTMVHDLRNPLTGIMGSLNLLSKHAGETLPPQYQTLFNIARSSTERMLSLVNAILDISRLESGRLPLTLEPFSLNELVQEVLTLQLPLAEQKQITLTSELPPEGLLVVGDKGLLGRVIQNLVGNALKFTPDEGQVSVSAFAQGAKIQVAIQDTGPGIPLDLQERLFQKFVTGTYEGKGSGLGLAFCRMVLEAHDERIWVSSKPGKGTTFTFTLSPVGQ